MPRAALLLITLGWAWSTLAETVRIGDRTFTVPDGLTVELIAGPPLADRPITCDFDEQGRLYVADSSGSRDPVKKQLEDKPHRILRLEDSDGDGVFDKRTVFADKMMFPEGTMWLDGSLYVAAPPQIWKLTDSDGDGVAEKREVWFDGQTLTGCANDLHGPYRGPDGYIYWCKGAFAKQTWPIGPHKKPFTTRASHIFRMRPDGADMDVVLTGGMDNPVDVVFMPGGERIMSGTFLQIPAAGRRDGLLHAVYGAVYGKVHDVIDEHVRTSPEVMPVLSHLGPSASCGLHRYEGAALGKEYTNNVFSAAFNLRKVVRHILKPTGATFESTDEDFLVCDNLDFHPTDIIEDADGSLIVVDTGGWYKLCCPTSQLHKPQALGGIYRVRRKDAERDDDPRGQKIAWSVRSEADLGNMMKRDDRVAVRKRAMNELVRRGPKVIKSLARDEEAVWVACRIGGPEARAFVRSLATAFPPEVRIAALHAISLTRDSDAAADLRKVFVDPCSGTATLRVAAEALGRIGDRGAVPMLLAQLAQPSNDRFLEHSIVFALIEINDPVATADGLKSDSAAVRRGALIALDQMDAKALTAEQLAAQLWSTDPRTRDAARWIAGRHSDWGDALAATLRQRLDAAAKAAPQEADELAAQLAGLAKSPAVAALIADAARSGQPASRNIALAAMAQANLKDAPANWLQALSALLLDKDSSIAAAASSALARMNLKKEARAALAPKLLEAASRSDLPVTARLDLLSTMPATRDPVSPPLATFILSQLDPAAPAPQRIAAADIIGKSRWSDEQLLVVAAAVGIAGPLELDRILPAFEQSKNDKVGELLVEQLAQSKALASLRADVLKTRLKKFSPAVQKNAESLYSKLNPDAASQQARLDQLLATLPAGDINRGQVVFNSTKAACATCHTIGYVGGKVGPDLTKIGAIRQNRDLLESILFPSSSFVQSFEPYIVETEDGDQQSGVLRRNDAQEVVLLTGPQQEVRIPRKDVKELRKGTVSTMPAGLEQQLSQQELADLVAFLKACK